MCIEKMDTLKMIEWFCQWCDEAVISEKDVCVFCVFLSLLR